MMMKENSKLTKNVHGDRNIFQCYYNNVGFCKFSDQCRYQHFKDVCSKSVCKDRECKFRHPKSCKFGENCKFFKLKCCFYSHKHSMVAISNKERDLINAKAENLEKAVQELQIEISDLKKAITDKEQKLKVLENRNVDQNKVLIDLQEENASLKQKLKEQTKINISKDEVITAKDDTIAHLRQKADTDKINPKHNEDTKLKENFYCDKCGFNASSLAILVKHKTNKHNPVLSCDQCDFKAFKKTDLQLHIRFKH